MVVSSLDKLLVSGTKYIGLRSDGTLGIKSKTGGWDSSSALNFKSRLINLNGAPTPPVPEIPVISNYKLADTKFNATEGWTVDPGALETIVTRAPTHEPYPYHSKGVSNKTNLNATVPTKDPVPTTNNGTETNTQTDIETKAAQAATTVLRAPLIDPIDAEDYISEPPAGSAIGDGA
jgi:hypothetical protein